MGRQFDQKGAFVLEGLGGNQSRLALGPMLHAHGGPLQGLSVEILQALEGAAGKEVGFHGPEAALLAGFAVGVADLVTAEPEPVLPAEALPSPGRSARRRPCPAAAPDSCCR